jgi:hypothetical protein
MTLPNAMPMGGSPSSSSECPTRVSPAKTANSSWPRKWESVQPWRRLWLEAAVRQGQLLGGCRRLAATLIVRLRQASHSAGLPVERTAPVRRRWHWQRPAPFPPSIVAAPKRWPSHLRWSKRPPVSAGFQRPILRSSPEADYSLPASNRQTPCASSALTHVGGQAQT